MDTSLIINATNSGKKVTKAITNINPDKENAILKTFAQKVNNLTTNTYVDATRINKQSVNEPDQQGGSSVTLVVNTDNYTGEDDIQISDIAGGKRLSFGQNAASGYVDISYSLV